MTSGFALLRSYWDGPGLRPFAAMLEPGHTSPGTTKYKETAWDWKQQHACAVGKNSGPKRYKETKNPNCYFWRSWSKSRVLHMPPAHHHLRGGPNTWAAGPTPGHTPPLILYKEHAHLPQGTSKGTYCLLLLHPTAAGAPIKPCLYFWSGP